MSNNSGLQGKHVELSIIDDLVGEPGHGTKAKLGSVMPSVLDGNIPGMSVSRGVMPPGKEITRCTQCGKKFTPKRRPCTTWNLNIYGGMDVLCKQCVAKNERASDKAIQEALDRRKVNKK